MFPRPVSLFPKALSLPQISHVPLSPNRPFPDLPLCFLAYVSYFFFKQIAFLFSQVSLSFSRSLFPQVSFPFLSTDLSVYFLRSLSHKYRALFPQVSHFSLSLSISPDLSSISFPGRFLPSLSLSFFQQLSLLFLTKDSPLYFSKFLFSFTRSLFLQVPLYISPVFLSKDCSLFFPQASLFFAKSSSSLFFVI